LRLGRTGGRRGGAEFHSGIRDSHEPEDWSDSIRLIDEWVYFDEDEPKIGFSRRFRRWRIFRRIQWAVHHALEPPRARVRP